MSDAIKHSHVDVNGVRLHIAEQGEGPLVLLLHGFPESWYSWRHQFAPLAAAGYRVVAPDQRGYARSEQPERIDAYTLLHLVGDATALIGALGAEQAVVVGHDWGAPVAWATAALRPDLVRGVAGLSVPPLPSGPRPLAESRAQFGDGFYQNYFQEPGRADAELAADPASTFRRVYAGSGPGAEPVVWVVPEGQKLIDTVPEPERLPAWITEADIEAYVADYATHGERAFTGGLNWYRNIDRNNELMAAFNGRPIQAPALFVVGEQDLVNAIVPPEILELLLTTFTPRLHRHVRLPETGHWTQQERPAEVTAALLDFLAHVESGASPA
ncbi:alpha/beta hydrolase [Streptomyces sp. SP17BM10]|uniref:alpha/beta fold hydrolase n=1 Tax=Streptomyces sp. SP17BM10 TaxID=3002530 RepID=UPI002E76F69A|nr:alpha/beta hydrolase [Streptomyces sp. SP17BM10]MEE1786092.1 alpha/beta hydrolase [Streptomyces sp. SP17BM10]